MFKLNDKVMVIGIDAIGTIVGRAASYNWIVLFEDRPFDYCTHTQNEWLAYEYHESGITKL